MQGVTRNLVFKLLIFVTTLLTFTQHVHSQYYGGENYYAANGTMISIVVIDNDLIKIQGQPPFATIQYMGDPNAIKKVRVAGHLSKTKDIDIEKIRYDYIDDADLCVLINRPRLFMDYSLFFAATRAVFQNAYSCPLPQGTYLMHKGFENIFAIPKKRTEVSCSEPWYFVLHVQPSSNKWFDLFYIVFQMDTWPVLSCA